MLKIVIGDIRKNANTITIGWTLQYASYIDRNLLNVLKELELNITIITNKYNNNDYKKYQEQYQNITLKINITTVAIASATSNFNQIIVGSIGI